MKASGFHLLVVIVDFVRNEACSVIPALNRCLQRLYLVSTMSADVVFSLPYGTVESRCGNEVESRVSDES